MSDQHVAVPTHNQPKKPTAPAPTAPAPHKAPAADGNAPDMVKGIPVALVEWDRTWKPPGKSAEQTLTSYEGNDGRSWKIEFLPSLRMMRVTHVDKTRPDRGGVRYLPIERVVSWEAG